jgi:polynucleotide 5'-kinase involved in rRNA processing
MLPIIVGAHRLVRKAAEWRATAVVVDTTGLVDPNQGGGALKMALVDLLRPKSVIGLQRGDEIEHLLVPLRRSLRTRVIDLDVANAAQRRDATTRRRHRAERFRRAFRAAGRLRASWIGLAVIPAPSFTEHRLVALENDAGFALALGIVVGCECSRHEVELLTPLDSLHGVDAIRLGDLAVDPQTFQDRRL